MGAQSTLRAESVPAPDALRLPADLVARALPRRLRRDPSSKAPKRVGGAASAVPEAA